MKFMGFAIARAPVYTGRLLVKDVPKYLQFHNRFLTKASVLGNRYSAVRSNHSSSYLGDSLSTDESIQTVKLAFDKHSPPNKPKTYKSPLIILHGLFGHKTNNRTVSKKLAAILERDVFCLDMRNFGKSPHIDRLDYPSLAADVEAFIDFHKFEKKPIIIGHSMGAKTAMAVALRRPDLPKMIIAVDNVPVDLSIYSVSAFLKYIKHMRIALERYKFTSMKDVNAELAKVEPSEMVRQFLMTNLDRGKTDDVIKSKIPLAIIDKAITGGSISGWPFDPNICRWTKGHVLVIRGTESDYCPDETLPDIGQYFPRFEVRDIKAGHWLISQAPDKFIEVVIDFIERHEDGEE